MSTSRVRTSRDPRGTSRFFDKDIPDARLQAELLLADLLCLKRSCICSLIVRDEEVDRYRSYVRQRLKRVPLQYIVGGAFGISSCLLHQTYNPRPETEILVDIALEKLANVCAVLFGFVLWFRCDCSSFP